jgi:hypothetical protein
MIEFSRGSTFQMMGTFLLDGAPLDVSQWLSVAVTLSDYVGQAVFATLDVQVIDPVNGVVGVSAGDTSAWPVGRARMDLQITDSNGNTYNSEPDYLRIIESMFNVGKGIAPA